jgi:hypothetical protein
MLDLGDEEVRGRQDHRVDQLTRRGELPDRHHDADRQHPPHGGGGELP